jgi:hypothetical protein
MSDWIEGRPIKSDGFYMIERKRGKIIRHRRMPKPQRSIAPMRLRTFRAKFLGTPVVGYELPDRRIYATDRVNAPFWWPNACSAVRSLDDFEWDKLANRGQRHERLD